MGWKDVEKSDSLPALSPHLQKIKILPKSGFIVRAINIHDESDDESAAKICPARIHDDIIPQTRCPEFESQATVTCSLHKPELPPKKNYRLFRWIRFYMVSSYRLLFSIVILGNLLALGALLANGRNGQIPRYNFILTAATFNIAMSILMRQELAINILFSIFWRISAGLPCSVRALCSRVYHYGGIHSGCGAAAAMWFTLFNFSIIHDSNAARTAIRAYPAILALTCVLDAILLGIIVMAHPKIRTSHHNAFELTHRYAGWTAILLFTVHVVSMTNFARPDITRESDLIKSLIVNPSFWLLLFIVLMIVLPWTRIKKVDVDAEFLSHHATRLHFTHVNASWCSSIRIADKPLKEWHSFVTIPTRNECGFSVIVSNAGDWTSRMIQKPPKQLWIRGIPTRNLLAMARIFSPVLFVCTGSGVGPILSFVTTHPKHQSRILWSARSPQQTFGQAIVGDILHADPRACIIDTQITRRPDLVQVAYELFVESGAEAVFAVSNPKVIRKMRYGLKSRGVPFFAPIFDS